MTAAAGDGANVEPVVAGGLERRTLIPTAAVALVVLLFTAGLPLVDAVVPPGNDVVEAGTRVTLVAGPALTGTSRTQQARFVPASGWEVSETGDEQSSRTVTKDGISFEIAAAPYQGACNDVLLAAEGSVQDIDPSAALNEAQSLTTQRGQLGLAASFVGVRTEGFVFALCERALAVTVEVSGPSGSLQGAPADRTLAMARSVEIV
jgi:hypothetical protein